MCQQITVLARYNDYRFISCCEHRTIHLIWERSSIRIHASDFDHMAEIMSIARTNPDQSVIRLGLLCLMQNAEGYAQLWMGGAGLHLSPQDFSIFADLVRTAYAMCTQAHVETHVYDLSTYCELHPDLNLIQSAN